MALDTFIPDENLLNSIIQFGIEESIALKALKNTNNEGMNEALDEAFRLAESASE